MGEVVVRAYAPEDFERVVSVWHATKRATYGFIEIEKTYSLETDRGFFQDHVVPRCDLFVAEIEDEIVGFLAMEGSYVDRLYVLPERQRQGVGERLLAVARDRSPAGLELHTHQKNQRACRFYEKNGFVAVKYGVSPPPESEPDVEYHWRR